MKAFRNRYQDRMSPSEDDTRSEILRIVRAETARKRRADIERIGVYISALERRSFFSFWNRQKRAQFINDLIKAKKIKKTGRDEKLLVALGNEGDWETE